MNTGEGCQAILDSSPRRVTDSPDFMERRNPGVPGPGRMLNRIRRTVDRRMFVLWTKDIHVVIEFGRKLSIQIAEEGVSMDLPRPCCRKMGVLLLLIGTLFGCASTQETSTLQQSVGMLHERVLVLENRFQGMEGQTGKSADLYARIEELQLKVGSLNGRIEELDRRIEHLSKSHATAPAATNAAPVSEPPSSSAVDSPRPASAPQPAISIPEKEPSEKALYDKALQQFQQGQYEGARRDFQTFLNKYPRSELADNALYSIGECYYAEKRYQDAISTFQQVLDRYPKGNKVPHALLKQGSAFQALGDATAARILYERLLEKFPDSPQAQAAEKKLKQLP